MHDSQDEQDIQIDIQNEQGFRVDVERLTQAALQVITQENAAPNSMVTVVITRDEDVQALNREFRGIDAPTDVLSFPAEPLPDSLMQEMFDDDEPDDDSEESDDDTLDFDGDEPDDTTDESDAPYLGDLVIAYPYALAQAEREGHTIGDSLVLLVVHGTLHLLGYDHDTLEHRAAMWAAQDQALRALGVPTHIVPTLEGFKGQDREQANDS